MRHEIVAQMIGDSTGIFNETYDASAEEKEHTDSEIQSEPDGHTGPTGDL